MTAPPDPWYVLTGHKAAVTTVEFWNVDGTGSSEFDTLVAGDASGEVKLWRLDSKRSVATFCACSDKGVLAAAGTSDGNLFTQGRDGELSLWDIQCGRFSEPAYRLPAAGLSFCKAALDDVGTGTLVVPAHEPSEVAIYDLRQREQVAVLPTPPGEQKLGMCMSLQMFRSSTAKLLLAAGYEDGSAILWDVAERAALSRECRHDDPILSLAVDPTRGTMAITGGASSTLKIAPLRPSTATASELAREQLVEVKHRGVSAISLRSDARILATGGWDSRLRLFSWPKMKPLAILERHRAGISALSWSQPLQSVSGKQLLAAGSKDKRISLWSLYN